MASQDVRRTAVKHPSVELTQKDRSGPFAPGAANVPRNGAGYRELQMQGTEHVDAEGDLHRAFDLARKHIQTAFMSVLTEAAEAEIPPAATGLAMAAVAGEVCAVTTRVIALKGQERAVCESLVNVFTRSMQDGVETEGEGARA